MGTCCRLCLPARFLRGRPRWSPQTHGVICQLRACARDLGPYTSQQRTAPPGHPSGARSPLQDRRRPAQPARSPSRAASAAGSTAAGARGRRRDRASRPASRRRSAGAGRPGARRSTIQPHPEVRQSSDLGSPPSLLVLREKRVRRRSTGRRDRLLGRGWLPILPVSYLWSSPWPYPIRSPRPSPPRGR